MTNINDPVFDEPDRALDIVPSVPDGWRDHGHVAEYLSREIPHRDIAEGMLLDALPQQVERFIDLGTGDGRLIALVRERHPGAVAIGIDFSEPMLERAAQRFAHDPLVEILDHDLEEPLPEQTPVDGIVSALAIHHLEHERKRSLFSEIHSLLMPGGVFVNLDLVASATPQQHERFRHAIGRPQDDPADRLAGLCEQFDWLKDAGFTEVDCHFKWMELALIVAVTPERE
jgi:cyclopropane fatty-acyl-phospholipid synthase-like methyltransferase